MTAHLTIVRGRPPPVTHLCPVRRSVLRQAIFPGQGHRQDGWLVVDEPTAGTAAEITISRRRPVATHPRLLVIRFPLEMVLETSLAESSPYSRPLSWLLAHEPAGLELVLLLRRAAPSLHSTHAAARLLVGLVVEAWQASAAPRGP